MRTLVPSSVRQSALTIILFSAVVLLAASALAGPQKTVRVTASGQIVSSDPCPGPPAGLCQDVPVTGIATVLGR
ncbi:MAG TPA: hypothetical protein VK504_26850, partial [Vicinamibacterales bacterium]|nr:hypothetical protein [Vicinamibacterales bacterium]